MPTLTIRRPYLRNMRAIEVSLMGGGIEDDNWVEATDEDGAEIELDEDETREALQLMRDAPRE
jgi:hypothetical protein